VIILPQLPNIAKFIATKKEGYKSIIEILVPIIHKLLMDTDPDVSGQAAEALASITEILINEDRQEHILTIVLSNLS